MSNVSQMLAVISTPISNVVLSPHFILALSNYFSFFTSEMGSI